MTRPSGMTIRTIVGSLNEYAGVAAERAGGGQLNTADAGRFTDPPAGTIQERSLKGGGQSITRPVSGPGVPSELPRHQAARVWIGGQPWLHTGWFTARTSGS